MKSLMSYLDNAARAALVFGLAQAAKTVMVLGVRLYARNVLSAVEMRFMLGFSSTLNSTAIATSPTPTSNVPSADGLNAGRGPLANSPGSCGIAAATPNLPPAAQYKCTRLIKPNTPTIHRATKKLMAGYPWKSPEEDRPLEIFCRQFVGG